MFNWFKRLFSKKSKMATGLRMFTIENKRKDYWKI